MTGFDDVTVARAVSRPALPAEMLAVLHLRRQAATRGWHLKKVARTARERVFQYERDDDGWVADGGYARIRVGHPDAPFEEYVPTRVAVNVTDGFVVAEHVGPGQAVAVVRGLLCWPLVDDRPWPPKSSALVPVAVYAGGAA